MKLTRTEIKKMEKFMSNMVIREIEEPSPEQLNNTEAWLEDAKNEYKSYKVLRENKLYPQMIEHLALCVEKMVKSFGFIYGSVDSNSVKSIIGHISPRVFIKIIEDTNLNEFVRKNLPGHKENFGDTFNELKIHLFSKEKVKQIEKKLMKIKPPQIRAFFQMIDTIATKLKEEFEDKTFKQIYENENSKHFFSSIMPIIKKSEEWKKLRDKKVLTLWKMPKLHMNLFMLSFILFPFYNISRYSVGSQISFDENLGVIGGINELDNRTLICLNELEKELRDFL